MGKQQFTIRSLLIATFVVAVSLAIAIRHYDDAMVFFFPPPTSPATTQLTAADIIPPNLLRRVDPSSSVEIVVRPLDNE